MIFDELGLQKYPEVSAIFFDLKWIHCEQITVSMRIATSYPTMSCMIDYMCSCVCQWHSAVDHVSAVDVGVWYIDWYVHGPLVWIFCWGTLWGLEGYWTSCLIQLWIWGNCSRHNWKLLPSMCVTIWCKPCSAHDNCRRHLRGYCGVKWFQQTQVKQRGCVIMLRCWQELTNGEHRK